MLTTAAAEITKNLGSIPSFLAPCATPLTESREIEIYPLLIELVFELERATA